MLVIKITQATTLASLYRCTRLLDNYSITIVVLVAALVERWTRDRKVAGSTPGRGAIKSTRSTQPCIPPG